MTYQEALDWIHGQLKFGIKPGLERMAWMLKELGNPQDNLKAVHIVGTNGKGSTVNALQTIFTQAGYCLLYTSFLFIVSEQEIEGTSVIPRSDSLFVGIHDFRIFSIDENCRFLT